MSKCSRCDGENETGYHRYCRKCLNEYQRGWRKTHPLSLSAQAKDVARSIAGVYKRRGVLKQEPCQVCGDPLSEMHHPDYDKPLEVVWLCKDHHLKLHKLIRDAVARKIAPRETSGNAQAG